MPAFVQSCSLPPGDCTFDSHLHAVATPYLLVPPSDLMSTASSVSQNTMIYQLTPNQTSGSSFVEEVIDTSLISEDLVFGSSHIAFPSQPTEPKVLGGNELPQNIVPTIEADNKSSRRPHNRRQSKVSSVISKSSVSGNTAESPKPRKRGRKPKKQLKGQKGVEQQEELYDDNDLPTDPHRRRVLERNRIAATKCRLRMRDGASALASREKAMEDQNRSLSAYFESLAAEAYFLKTELMRHTDCNCVLIQKYIAQKAQKSMNSLLACSSASDAHGVSLGPNYGSSSNAITADGIPPAETKYGPRASEVREDVFGMNFEPFYTTPMPPDSMISAHLLPSVPLVGCGPGLYENMGPQEHQADEIGWDAYWSFEMR